MWIFVPKLKPFVYLLAYIFVHQQCDMMLVDSSEDFVCLFNLCICLYLTCNNVRTFHLESTCFFFPDGMIAIKHYTTKFSVLKILAVVIDINV